MHHGQGAGTSLFWVDPFCRGSWPFSSMASMGLSWVGLNPTEEPKKRALLPDWALSAEELKQRVKQREKRARRAEREAAARRGKPLPPPICHRPRVADNAAAPDTLVKRRRKAEKEALLALRDGHERS